MIYVLDTNHAGTILRPDAALRKRFSSQRTEDVFALCRPVVAELWFMIFNSGRVTENQRDLENLLQSLPVFEFDADAAMEYGKLRTELKRAGRPIPAVDSMIAAIARVRGATVLSADKHFHEVAGLNIQSWL